MRLNVNEAAALLETPADTIYRWIESGDLPAYRVNEQFRINRTELLEWAILRNVAVGPAVFQDDDDGPAANLGNALSAGGVIRALGGNTRADVLRSLVGHLALSNEDKTMLQHLLVARDTAAFVSIPDGVAIPHVRHPIVLSSEPRLYAYFLATPIEFTGALVQCLFVLLTPTVRIHLQLLAKLSYLLRDEGMKEAIRRNDPGLSRVIRDIEGTVA